MQERVETLECQLWNVFFTCIHTCTKSVSKVKSRTADDSEVKRKISFFQCKLTGTIRKKNEKKWMSVWILNRNSLWTVRSNISNSWDGFIWSLCATRSIFSYEVVVVVVVLVRLSTQWMTTGTIDFHLFELFWCEEVHKPKKISQKKRSKGSGNKILRTHDDTKSGTHNLLTSCIPIKFYRFSAVTYFDSDFEFIVIKKTAHTKSVANTSRLKKSGIHSIERNSEWVFIWYWCSNDRFLVLFHSVSIWVDR